MKFALHALFWFGVLFTIGAPLGIGIFLNNPKVAWIAAVCGAFVTFVSRLDQMAEVSLGPVRAKMRETIEEANATIEQLRATAATLSKFGLGHSIAQSFIGSISLADRMRLHDEVIDHLRALGLSDDQIEQADEIWNRGISAIYVRAIENAIRARASNSDDNNLTSQQETLLQKIKDIKDFDNEWKMPSASDLSDLVKQWNQSTPVVEKWLSEYQHFEKTGEIRNKDQFANM